MEGYRIQNKFPIILFCGLLFGGRDQSSANESVSGLLIIFNTSGEFVFVVYESVLQNPFKHNVLNENDRDAGATRKVS